MCLANETGKTKPSRINKFGQVDDQDTQQKRKSQVLMDAGN